MSEINSKIALHCLKAYSEHHNEMCEECEIYGHTGEDHCFEDMLEFAIHAVETLQDVYDTIDGYDIKFHRDRDDLSDLEKDILEVLGLTDEGEEGTSK